jgi:hypothetical protein
MTFSPDLCGMLKNNPWNINYMHPKDISCGAPAAILSQVLILNEKPHNSIESGMNRGEE